MVSKHILIGSEMTIACEISNDPKEKYWKSQIVLIRQKEHYWSGSQLNDNIYVKNISFSYDPEFDEIQN